MRCSRRCVLAAFALVGTLALAPTGAAAHSWRVSRIDPHGGLSSISCPSANLCVAADRSLHLLSSTRPLGSAGAWREFEGRGWPGNDGNPSGYFGQPFGYTGVSCPSSRLCVAVDDSGDIVVSQRPAGGRSAWHGALVDCGECLMAPSGDLSGVSCTRAAVCVAADAGNGDYTTEHPFNLDSWNPPADQTGAPYGVSCGPGGLCLEYGQGVIAWSLHPGRANPVWHPSDVDTGHDIDGSACPSPSLCVGVDHRGNVLSSADPTAGSPQWTVVNVDGTTPLEAIACPTVSLCIAVDDQGQAAVSTAPTAGAQAWRLTRVDGDRFMTAISCASASLCVAVDRSGNAVLAKDP